MEQSVTTRLKRLITDSNEALEFRLIRSVDDLNSDKTIFKPEMSYQIFGDRFVIMIYMVVSGYISIYKCINYPLFSFVSLYREIIFGFGDLKIQLFYAAGCLETYLGMSYTEKASIKSDGVEADEVLTKIIPKLASDIHYSLDNFTRALTKDDTFVPYGELINSFMIEGIFEVFSNFVCNMFLFSYFLACFSLNYDNHTC
jgi:histone acetyltransferase 1